MEFKGPLGDPLVLSFSEVKSMDHYYNPTEVRLLRSQIPQE